MSPEDDVTWPRCPVHTNSSGHGARHWCDVVRTFLVKGRDADDIDPGGRYCVPIVPSLDLFAEVSIGSELIAISADLALVKGSDPFAMNEDLIPLGRWATGEGRLVIASVVSDWAEGHASDKCTATSHGFHQEMILQERAKVNDPTFWKANKWCLAYYGNCYPCHTAKPKTADDGPVSFNASSFGVDPNDFGGSSGSTVGNRQQRTRDALRSRFQ